LHPITDSIPIMKKFLGLCALASAAPLAGPNLAGSVDSCLPLTMKDVATPDAPRFEQFPASVVSIAKPAAPDEPAPNEDESKEGFVYYRSGGEALIPVKAYRSAKTPCAQE
jgi:hypothetical protein